MILDFDFKFDYNRSFLLLIVLLLLPTNPCSLVVLFCWCPIPVQQYTPYFDNIYELFRERVLIFSADCVARRFYHQKNIFFCFVCRYTSIRMRRAYTVKKVYAYCNVRRLRTFQNNVDSIRTIRTLELWFRSSCQTIGRVSYIRIYLCYFCFRWKTVSLVQASMRHLMHHVTVSLQQSKITLQNNCINNTSITQPTLTFYLWLKM